MQTWFYTNCLINYVPAFYIKQKLFDAHDEQNTEAYTEAVSAFNADISF